MINGRYIDVLKLVQKEYRRSRQSEGEYFSVQIAGYKNSVVPENCHTSILSGWTGNEVIYANYVSEMWDEMERQSPRSFIQA